MRESCRIERFRKPNHHIGESPEIRLAAIGVVQKHRQSSHRTQSALDQFKRSSQGELAGVPGDPGFPALRWILQLVKTNSFFITGQRRDLLNDAIGRQVQVGDAWVKRQDLGRYRFEIVDCAMTLMKQRGQSISSRQSVFDMPLNSLCVVTGQLGDPQSFFLQPILIQTPDHAGCSA